MDNSTHYCTKCNLHLPVASFGRNSRSSSGLKSRCHICTNEYERSRKDSNPRARETARLANRKWSEAHPERHRANAKLYYDRHRDEIKIRRAVYRSENAERLNSVSAQRRLLPGQREAATYRSKTWRQENPERFREAIRRNMAKRRAILRSVAVVHFNAEQLEQRLAYFGFRCWMCGGEYEHLDHVKPVKRSGPHMLANLRPSCAACNIAKSAQWFGPSQLHRFIKN